MKKSIDYTIVLVVAAAFLFAVAAAHCQTTTVTLQATDADGQSWNNGSWIATLYSPPGVPNGPFNILGTSTAVPNQTQGGFLSGTGGASLTLTPNASIAPAGTQWQFSFCPQATAACTQIAVTIVGATQTVAPALAGIRASVLSPINRVTAYRDTEITGANVGAFYLNLTDQGLHVCITAVSNLCTVWSVMVNTVTLALDFSSPTPFGNTLPNTGNFTTLGATGIINTATGYELAGAAVLANYLRGNGTNFVSSTIQVTDVPTLNQSTTGNALTATTAANLSGTPALPNGTTATTQAPLDNSTKLDTTAYANAAVGVETTRATTAEGLLAPKASPLFTGDVQIGASNTGLSQLAAGVIGVGNGTAGDWTGNLRLARSYFSRANATTYDYVLDPASFPNISLSSSFGVGWSSTTNANAAADTNLSRLSAASVAVGNGTAGDTSGTLLAAAVVSNRFSSTASATINTTTAVSLGGSVGAQLSLVRDSTNGGSAVIYHDANASTVVVLNTMGPTTFAVTASPTAAQVGLAIVSNQVVAKAGSSRAGAVITIAAVSF
jgi:hypothetical protein